jgi:serine/threonine protein kinase
MKRVKLEESEVRVIMEQMLLALDFFQRKKVIHRDIKLDNVLINAIEDKADYEIRVADFGLAAFNPKDEMLFHKCGSPGYVAPEVFKGQGYSYHADIFSLGAVFFNLVSGRYLFSGKDLQELLKRNIECETATIK